MHFATSMYCNVFQMYHVFMEADNAFTYLLVIAFKGGLMSEDILISVSNTAIR